LATESLTALQKRDATLVSEISALDSELQTLVYDNYSKFISAVDTVKKMKSNVESRQEEMKSLERCMTLLTDRTEKIDRELNPKRDKMQQLGNVHKLLQKVPIVLRVVEIFFADVDFSFRLTTTSCNFSSSYRNDFSKFEQCLCLCSASFKMQLFSPVHRDAIVFERRAVL
jgi:hypothetical protein